MTIDTDTEHETVTIAAVKQQADGWAIEHSDGWSFWVSSEHGIEPHVGDVARFYGRGTGYPVRGLSLNGRTVFYRTAAEQDEKQRREIEADKQKRRDHFEREGRANLDSQYAALPVEFKARLDGLRRRSAEFRVEHEPYEMFVCREAVAIAQHFKRDDAVRKWAALPWDDQKLLWPGLSEDHSGNTFGAAVRLACLWLTRPDLVAMEHGALCPLVGCKDYGCASTEAP